MEISSQNSSGFSRQNFPIELGPCRPTKGYLSSLGSWLFFSCFRGTWHVWCRCWVCQRLRGKYWVPETWRISVRYRGPSKGTRTHTYDVHQNLLIFGPPCPHSATDLHCNGFCLYGLRRSFYLRRSRQVYKSSVSSFFFFLLLLSVILLSTQWLHHAPCVSVQFH